MNQPQSNQPNQSNQSNPRRGRGPSSGKPSRGKPRSGGRPNNSGRPGNKNRSGNRNRSGGGRGQGQPTLTGQAARVGPSPLDNRDTGIYSGGKLQEKPKAVHDGPPKLRIIPLGGLDEIGMNCMAIEYGQDIIIIDIGLMFPDETMPGVDYAIPDVSYLEKKKENIRGIIITHGHLDHIGGAPYLLPKLGYPDIYATQLAEALIRSNLEEHKLEKRVQFRQITSDSKLRLGIFDIEFFHISHSIPEGNGIAIHTPVGTITHAIDFKLDRDPVADKPPEFDKIKAIGERGVLLSMHDSTNVERPGRTTSEAEIGRNLAEHVGKAKGRVIISMFASSIARIQESINAAEKSRRKVVPVGRSMLRNIDICRKFGYLKIPKGIMVDRRKTKSYTDNQLLFVCTGAQADEYSALQRMSTGESKAVKIKQGDTVIVSASQIPGNERAIGTMMDGLFRQGADVIYAKIFDIHTSGHAYQDELKEMLQMLKPKHFIPIHGEYHKRVLHGRLAVGEGLDPANIHLPDNGRVVEVNHKGEVGISKEQAGGNLVLVDGLGVGDVGQIVLRDRKHMAEDGMFVIIATVERKSGRLIGSPDIISRGFIYLRESGKLLDDVRKEVKQKFGGNKNKPGDWAFLKNKIRDDVGDYLFKQTERRPMVLPVIIEV